jgi:hypothetical protein
MHQKDPQGGVSATRAMLRRWILPHSSVFQGSRSRWRAARPRSGFCGKRSMQVQMYTHMTRCSPVLPEHWGKVSCHAVQPVLLPCTDISSRRARSQEFAQPPPTSLARNRPANALARYPEPRYSSVLISHGLTGGNRTAGTWRAWVSGRASLTASQAAAAPPGTWQVVPGFGDGHRRTARAARSRVAEPCPGNRVLFVPPQITACRKGFVRKTRGGTR